MGFCPLDSFAVITFRVRQRQFQRGELTAEQLGVSPDCEYGAKLEKPFVEVTTKLRLKP